MHTDGGSSSIQFEGIEPVEGLPVVWSDGDDNLKIAAQFVGPDNFPARETS